MKKRPTNTKKINQFLREERREIRELKTHKQGWGRFFVDSVKLIYDFFIPHAGNDHRPLHLRPKALRAYAALAIGTKVAIIAFLFIAYPNAANVSAIISQNIIALINNARTEAGVPPLAEQSILTVSAYEKGRDMMGRGYFSHDTPEGKRPWEWINKQSYDYVLAGENLAIDFTSAERVHQALMDSESHRKNILNADYKDIGIAVITNKFQGRTTTLLVQFFGTQRSSLQKTLADVSRDQIQYARVLTTSTPASVLGVINVQELPVIGTQPRSTSDRILEFSRVFFLGFLLFMIGSLALNVLVKVRVQHRDTILQTLALIALLGALTVVKFHGLESVADQVRIL